MNKRMIGTLKKILNMLLVIGGLYFIMRAIAKKRTEEKDIDENNTYLNEAETLLRIPTIYERTFKPFTDKILSFVGLVLLAPLFAVISLAILIDDPGTIFFTQKRVGKDKQFFCLHKFRSMKMSTPHDVPTHQLSDPEQYITRVGKILRKTSMDELPQIWDIFCGNMSIIGPRPALWNQEDLIAEREKYGANRVLPGLTGWAQINGRDELEISEKAELDGEYVVHLQQGGFKALFFDVKCFLGTITSVLKSSGVVEGGTGELHRNKMDVINVADAGFEDYGYRKNFGIDKSAYKRIQITGANSYIGESFKTYAEKYYGDNFFIDTVDTIDNNWKQQDFSSYDVVFHVAGIAHADVGEVDEETKKKYYAVNTDLAIQVAEQAKAAGVRQFIFMSSMIIYGDALPYGKKKVIDEFTLPAPANCYGDSKWQADKGVRKLADTDFHVAVLRPPMIYGPGSKGNYPILAKLARRLPVFPAVENQRSMLYIDNLCEFLCLLMLSKEGGIYFPQNEEYTNTSMLAKTINEVLHKHIYNIRFLNLAVLAASHMPGKISSLVNKAFGSSIYTQNISTYAGIEYHVRTLKESIEETERNSNEISKAGKPSVLILVNHDVVIYNFRLELVERLLKEGYEVHISSPYGERIADLTAIGAKYHEIAIDRHGMNPIKEIFIFNEYRRLLKAVKPIIVLGYTIKPNIYGAMAARNAGVPFVANITGLGTAVANNSIRQKLIIALYRFAFADIQTVFFQNTGDMDFFKKQSIAAGKHKILPGSGVNLKRFPLQPYPECGDGTEGEVVRFAFVSRIMKEKGIEQYLEAAEMVRKLYSAVEFHVCGFCEPEYEGRLEELNNSGVIIYHGMIRNVAEFIKTIHCVVHPTYYPEGISNVLLEACSSGRPIITTDRRGCREVVDNGVNGYMIPEKNSEELFKAIKHFLQLSNKEKMIMGLNGRRKVEEHFSRDIVIEAYLKEIENAERV